MYGISSKYPNSLKIDLEEKSAKILH